MSHNPNETGLDRAQVTQVVIASLQELLETMDNDRPKPDTITEETRLLGRDAALDSMGLVSLIVDIEQRLEDELDLTVVLADERAMSQQRSPFRSIQSLSDYILQLAQEQ